MRNHEAYKNHSDCGEAPNSKEPSVAVRKWAVLDHLSALLGLLGVPLGHILGPLLIWWVKKEDDVYLDEQGKEALNFNLSVLLYGIGLGAVGAILIALNSVLAWVASGIFFVFSLFWLISIVVAAVHAHDGHHFRYPLTIHFLK